MRCIESTPRLLELRPLVSHNIVNTYTDRRVDLLVLHHTDIKSSSNKVSSFQKQHQAVKYECWVFHFGRDKPPRRSSHGMRVSNRNACPNRSVNASDGFIPAYVENTMTARAVMVRS